MSLGDILPKKRPRITEEMRVVLSAHSGSRVFLRADVGPAITQASLASSVLELNGTKAMNITRLLQ